MNESTTAIPAANQVASAAATAAPRIPARFFRIGGGVFLLFAGGYGIFSDQHYVTSSNAIVSAYEMTVRTPIDGPVSGLATTGGVRVRVGDVLGHVENQRVDRQHLENLRALAEEARSGAEALRTERSSLEKQRDDLMARADEHGKAVSLRLQNQISEAEDLLAAKEAALREQTSELQRGERLYKDGVMSTSDFEKLQSAYDEALHEAAAQKSDLAALQAEADAAGKGLFTEPGVNNDVAYSTQRADEVSLRLADTDRALTVLETQTRQAQADVDAEARHTNLMTQADLVSPISGMLWKLEAVNGERLATGDSVAELVNCSQSFVLAEIPQERVPDIPLGAPAHFKLSGEGWERTGAVLSVSGDPQKEDNRKLAAFPVQDTREQLATVRIGMSAGEANDTCLVGRTARVRISTNGTSLGSVWFRSHF